MDADRNGGDGPDAVASRDPAEDPEVTVEERGRPPTGGVAASLRRAAGEHLPYFLFATALFLAGVAVGAAMVGQVDLFALLGVEDLGELLPEDVTALTILINNTRAVVVMVLGALTLGLLTALALAFNGVIVGYVAGGAAAERGLAFVLLALLPHGVFELPAVFLAGAVAFRIVHMAALRVLGRRDVVLGRDGWKRVGLLLVAAWIALAVAAVVEFYVTTAILRAVFGSA